MLSLVPEVVETYAEQHTRDVAANLHALREKTYAEMSSPNMQVGRIEGQFLKLLVRLSGARRILEIGMFTGYSALMMAEGMADGGELITCDVDPKAEAIAREAFSKSPHGKKITIRMGPALKTIESLQGTLDMVFIDADKGNYPNYWEAVVPRVKAGGLIVADNVLWSGKVVETEVQDEDTRAIRAFNDRVQSDPRVENVLVSVRDGMMLSWKK